MARVIRTRAEVIPAPLADARARGVELLAEARAEAERIVSDARAQAANTQRAAEETGRAAGLATVAALEARALEARRRAVEDAERTVVALVTKIAERVLGEALADAPERIVPAVRAQLERVRRARTVEIRVHPEDALALEASLARGGLGDPERAVTVVPDAGITRGGCVLASDLGTLDARLEVQLEAFERALGETR